VKRPSLLELLKARYPQIETEELRACILCGEVWADGERVRDPRALVSGPEAPIALKRKRFVSRGGEKLEAVLEAWGVEVRGLVLIDAGCSTGGFTDCLLQRGARRVLAVDVGAGQLDYRLRRDARVTVLERTNVLALSAGRFPEQPDAAVADLSFRSLRGAAAHLLSLTRERWLIALVKPQFERAASAGGFHGLGRFGGVVREPAEVRAILKELAVGLEREGVFLHRARFSALRGAKGNRECFFLLKKCPGSESAAALLGNLPF
jgi:23S rRNA (cytidine1920-2'-O)/16S rRNA (cytidine1409-2'-O)-methyltransferase